MLAQVNLVPHFEHPGDRRKSRGDLLTRNLKTFQSEFRSHQEIAGLTICMVVRVQNVAAKIMDEPGDSSHDPLTILAGHQENDRIFLFCH